VVNLDVMAVQGVGPMALTRGRFVGYEFDRMVMLFSMVDGQREIPCAISTSAMDDLEGVARSRPNQREAQFMRLRDRIESCSWPEPEHRHRVAEPGARGSCARPNVASRL
jgi:Protein of unknown function (DUF1488)